MMTADGWSLSVDRLLIAMGQAGFEYPCNEYSNARYSRVLDATLPKEQKVSVIFGLGQCRFRVAMTLPEPDTVLGEGVTEADLVAMGSLVRTEPGRLRPVVSVALSATAVRGEESKRVRWMLRQGAGYHQCSRRAADGTSLGLELHSDEHLTMRMAVKGTAIFADDAAATAVLRFDPIAAADTDPRFGNDDGEVTLDEINRLPIEEARRFGGKYSGEPAGSMVRTLQDYLYLVLIAKMVQFPGEIGCEVPMRVRPL